jgi:hypothetical protein
MADHAKNKETEKTNLAKARPYAPSWVNHLNIWVSGLSGASWSYYLGLFVSLILIQSVVGWIEGAFTVGTFQPVQIFIAGALTFFLALIHYLDQRAVAALATLRPALKSSEEEYPRLEFQLSRLPAGSTLLASLITLTIILLTELVGEPYRLDVLNAYPLSSNLFRFLYLLGWWVLGAFLYHTLHQLRWINRIYTQHTQVNLFRMKPLYAFPNLTALTAASLTVVTYGWRAIAPGAASDDPISLAVMLVILFVAGASFIWPQLGIHSLQVAEKDRLLEEANQRLEATILKLHERVDGGELDNMEALNLTLSTLEMELSALKRIPTWPWQPETVRWLVTALVLPLGLWALQIVLQRVLGM